MEDDRGVGLERGEAQWSVAGVQDFSRLRLGRFVEATAETLVAAVHFLRRTGSGRPDDPLQTPET